MKNYHKIFLQIIVLTLLSITAFSVMAEAPLLLAENNIDSSIEFGQKLDNKGPSFQFPDNPSVGANQNTTDAPITADDQKTTVTPQTTTNSGASASGYCIQGAHSNYNESKLTPLIQCGGAGQPCCDFQEAVTLIRRLLNWFILMATTIATITFGMAGAKMLMNPENPGKREEAIEMFKKTLYGFIIILVAWLIVHTVVVALVNPNTNATHFLGGN